MKITTRKKTTLNKLRGQSINLYYLIFFGKEDMYWLWAIAFMVALRGSATKEAILGKAKLEHYWDEAFKVMIHVHIPYPVSDGWRMALLFSQPIKKINVWRAKVIAASAEGRRTH